ncbi:hypothetical protein [uncultured Maribacter sp.]|uniref:hypothetical protein n=1 Tax=uncultured Maribacter sp. TaxID=431308 RepID=UPI00260FAC04|nr:hypothetical protein [uncultured Maribacter sp.]
MFRRKYKVKGEDVNDYMVMQDFAYVVYAISLIKSYVIKNGYSKKVVEGIKMNIENSTNQLVCIKNLMFTQDFLMYLDSFNIQEGNNKVLVETRFFNAKNELCATLVLKT